MDWCRVQSYDGIETIVDIHLLRTHPLLTTDESRIFRWISGLEKHPKMKKNTDRKVEEDLQRMFTNYRIKSRYWKSLVGYLLAPESYKYRPCEIGDIFDLCVSIGLYGVPIKVNMEKKALEEQQPNNPMTPQEDVKEKYQWKMANPSAWDNTGTVWSAAGRTSSIMVWYRRRILNEER